MRSLIFTISFLLALTSISCAQGQVPDTHPRAHIFVIDPQSGQEVPATSDPAILFKNSLVDLVSNTYTARGMIYSTPGGYDNITITQMGAETNINGYKIAIEHHYPGDRVVNFTFVFHGDDNTLYIYDTGTRNWVLERIMPDNAGNLQNASYYAGQFNPQMGNQQQGQNPQQTGYVSVDLSVPVDENVSAYTPPPAMPEYEQPACPSDGYLWQPGYWAYSPGRGDYYWVPGAWVAPPQTGVLWTPPYWEYNGNQYVYHSGYWSNHIGFYGGINYGYGYSGRGYAGGEWRGNSFNYNTAVVRVNTTVVHNTYVNTTVINNTVVNNHNSFNGQGGVVAKPTANEIAVTKEPHFKPTAEQNGNQLQAKGNPGQFAKANPGGKPANLANPKIQPYKPQPGLGNKGGNPGMTGNQPVNQQSQHANTEPSGLKTNNAANHTGTTVTPVQNPPQKTNPVKPLVLTNPVKPQTQTTNPVKQQVKPVNPGLGHGTDTTKHVHKNTKPRSKADTTKAKTQPKT